MVFWMPWIRAINSQHKLGLSPRAFVLAACSRICGGSTGCVSWWAKKSCLLLSSWASRCSGGGARASPVGWCWGQCVAVPFCCLVGWPFGCGDGGGTAIVVFRRENEDGKLGSSWPTRSFSEVIPCSSEQSSSAPPSAPAQERAEVSWRRSETSQGCFPRMWSGSGSPDGCLTPGLVLCVLKYCQRRDSLQCIPLAV